MKKESDESLPSGDTTRSEKEKLNVLNRFSSASFGFLNCVKGKRNDSRGYSSTHIRICLQQTNHPEKVPQRMYRNKSGP